MARGLQAVLAIVLVASMTLAGCLSPDLQEWGPDGIEVAIDKDAGIATMSTHTGDLSLDKEEANLLGCDSDGKFSIAEPATNKKIHIEGWLHLSKHFPDGAASSSQGEMMSASAVIIELGRYDNIIPPEQGKVDGVKWNNPSVGVQARPPGQDSSSKFPHMGWAVVGLIPANEEILDGFGGLDWHQKIRLEGWLLDGGFMGNQEIHVSDDGRCRIYAGGNNAGFAGTMLITSMEMEKHGVIDEENSYNAYNVPVISFTGYTLLLLGSIGGAVFLFFAVSGLIRRGATLSAKELMTEAQMIAAKGVKREVKHDTKRLEAVSGEKIDLKAQKSTTIKAEKRSNKPTIELDDFDIDSALKGAHRPSAKSIQSASSGGVIQTEEALEMQAGLDAMDEARELEEAMQEGRVVGQGGEMVEPPSSGMVVTRSKPAPETSTESDASSRKVRKTRTVKKEPEPEPEPSPPTTSGPDITDDDDFSDFTF
jgi:hypothetical protein